MKHEAEEVLRRVDLQVVLSQYGRVVPTGSYFLDVMIPAMVTLAVLAATLLGIPELLVNARENGVFRSYRINGVPATSILFIPAITTTLHVSIVSIIIIVTASPSPPAPLDEGARRS